MLRAPCGSRDTAIAKRWGTLRSPEQPRTHPQKPILCCVDLCKVDSLVEEIFSSWQIDFQGAFYVLYAGSDKGRRSSRLAVAIADVYIFYYIIRVSQVL